MEYTVPWNLVLSEDGYCFEDLLPRLSTAKRILICTFGMPYKWKKSPYAQLAMSTAADEVIVVINVPQGDSRKKQLIGLKNFRKASPHVKIFYNPACHLKLMVVDDTIFLGSANFTSGTQKNFECGITVEDRTLATDIRDWVHGEVIPKSHLIPTGDGSVAEVQILLAEIEERLRLIDEEWGIAETLHVGGLVDEILEMLPSAEPNQTLPLHFHNIQRAAEALLAILEQDPVLPRNSNDPELAVSLMSDYLSESPEDATDLFAELAADDAQEIYSLRAELEPALNRLRLSLAAVLPVQLVEE